MPLRWRWTWRCLCTLTRAYTLLTHCHTLILDLLRPLSRPLDLSPHCCLKEHRRHDHGQRLHLQKVPHIGRGCVLNSMPLHFECCALALLAALHRWTFKAMPEQAWSGPCLLLVVLTHVPLTLFMVYPLQSNHRGSQSTASSRRFQHFLSACSGVFWFVHNTAPQHHNTEHSTSRHNTTTPQPTTFFFSFSFVFLFLFFRAQDSVLTAPPPPPTTQRQVQLTADTFANPSPIDRDTIERISGLALDFTIVSAIAVSRFACILCSTSPFPSPRWAGFADITTPALSLLPHHAHHT